MSAKNFATNPGFETAGADADNPSGWTFAGNNWTAANNTGRHTGAPAAVKEGSYSYRLGTSGYTGGDAFGLVTVATRLEDNGATLVLERGSTLAAATVDWTVIELL